MGFILSRSLCCFLSNTDFQCLRYLLKIFPKSPVDPERVIKYLVKREPETGSGPTFPDIMNLNQFFVSRVNLEALF